MLVIMKAGATKDEIAIVCGEIESAGLKPHINEGTERIVVTCLGSIGAEKANLVHHFRTLPGVEDSKLLSTPYKLSARSSRPGPFSFPINGVSVGEEKIIVIAGPCAVESHDQFIKTAHALKELGAHVLRGMIFKPRTDPYSFQGLGEEGLELLREAKRQTGLPIVTEVLSEKEKHVELLANYCDIFQVGARNSQNFELLKEIAKIKKPCLFKRGPGEKIEDFLRATEYFLSKHSDNIMLCLRGIVGIDQKYTRNQADLGDIAVLKSETFLPVIYDPSHASGNKKFVVSQALAAIAMGADGIEIEVHPDPTKAKCDADQQLTIPEFADFMEQARKVAAAVGRTI